MDSQGSGPRWVCGTRGKGTQEGLCRVQEFNEASASVFAREKGVNSVMVDGVEEKTSCFPKGIAVEKDMGYRPGDVAVGTCGVIVRGRTKLSGVSRVESVVCGELKSSALQNARLAR